MTVLTPTFAENQKTGKRKKASNGGQPVPPKVVAPHEPLSQEGWQPPAVAFTPFPTMGATITPQQQVAPVAEPIPLKVACIGTAPSSRMLAPFNDPSWQIWACSPGNMNTLPKVDVWFEIHGNLLWPECESYGRPYIEWLKQQKFPIYMQDSVLVPNATPYPKDEIIQEFGPFYFTSSFSWMMALALKKGAKEIALYGIDMASREEYIIQRPGAYYFFMEGAKRGCKVWAPYESDIMQPPGLYGYSDITQFGRKIHAREKEIKDRIAGLAQQKASIQEQETYLRGAAEDIDYFKSIHIGAQDNDTAADFLNGLIEKSRSQQSSQG